MSTTVQRPPKIMAFSANGIAMQAYEVRKQVQDLKINVALFSEANLKPHIKFHIPNYDIYRTDREDWHKGGTAAAVKKGIPHTCVDLSPLLSAEATGISIPIGDIQMFIAAVYKSPQGLWSDTDIREL
jgi:hypothetical protein